jgi:hypothetical protein
MKHTFKLWTAAPVAAVLFLMLSPGASIKASKTVYAAGENLAVVKAFLADNSANWGAYFNESATVEQSKLSIDGSSMGKAKKSTIASWLSSLTQESRFKSAYKVDCVFASDAYPNLFMAKMQFLSGTESTYCMLMFQIQEGKISALRICRDADTEARYNAAVLTGKYKYESKYADKDVLRSVNRSCIDKFYSCIDTSRNIERRILFTDDSTWNLSSPAKNGWTLTPLTSGFAIWGFYDDIPKEEIPKYTAEGMEYMHKTQLLGPTRIFYGIDDPDLFIGSVYCYGWMGELSGAMTKTYGYMYNQFTMRDGLIVDFREVGNEFGSQLN